MIICRNAEGVHGQKKVGKHWLSSLRRVKTWLRSTMSDERLSGLCVMNQREKISKDKYKKGFIEICLLLLFLS